MSPPVSAELRALLEGYGAPAILLSPEYRILAANQGYCEVYGEEGELVGQTCHAISHRNPVPCDQAGETCPLRESRETGRPRRALHIHHTPRGDEHVDVETRPVFDDVGRLSYFVEILRQARSASARPSATGLVGRAPAFNRMLELVQRVGATEVTALLMGESGTGKELVARAIHELSARARGAFVPVECSGLTESLFESELFGHEKGAFTGAHSARVGLVEASRGGTLFLDEVGDIPLQLQVKLLRLLETGTFRRVGSAEPQQADFRLICATHRDLPRMADEGQFRADLYYRINAFPIELPALRERSADIPLLADTLLRRLPTGQRLRLSDEALACLGRYDFPGNVRELRNILERASLLTDDALIRPEHLPAVCRLPGRPGAAAPPAEPMDIMPLEEQERAYLARCLAIHRGDRRELAARLGVSERTLFRKLRGLKGEVP